MNSPTEGACDCRRNDEGHRLVHNQTTASRHPHVQGTPSVGPPESKLLGLELSPEWLGSLPFQLEVVAGAMGGQVETGVC